jgi:hypothetical protein
MNVISIYAQRQGAGVIIKEMQEKYNITAIPLSKGLVPNTIFMDENTVIFVDAANDFFKYDLISGEREMIRVPPGWHRRRIDGFRNIVYDKMSNSLHMIVQENIFSKDSHAFSYAVLYLDTYIWEEISELGNNISDFFYDPIKNIIYIKQFFHRDFYNYELLVFDLNARKFIQRIELKKEIRTIYCMYGEPLKILAYVSDQNSDTYHFYIFDTETRTGIETDSYNSSDFLIQECISLSDKRFLGISVTHQNESHIFSLDVFSDTTELVLLKRLPYHISRFTKVNNEKYSFIILSSDGWSLLCFIELPNMS